jgi:hypothetical protein
MAANEIHENDIGTLFQITLKDGDVVVDVSTASQKVIIFTDPEGVKVEKAAQFLSDGTDGIITYTTEDGDLSPVGSWKLQARVTLSTGTWSSDIDKFKVYPNL